jgi:hypothetical protein
MSTVTIYEVNATRTAGRQLYPAHGEAMSPDELVQVESKATAKATWNCNGEVLVSPARGAVNLVHKLPFQPRERLYGRIGHIVTTWYPRQDVVILIEPAG